MNVKRDENLAAGAPNCRNYGDVGGHSVETSQFEPDLVASVDPDTMTETAGVVLSPRMHVLAEALRLLHARLRKRLAEPRVSDPAVPIWVGMAEAVVQADDACTNAALQLASEIDALGGVFSANEGEASILAAVRRLEVPLDALLCSRDEVRGWDVPPSYKQARDRLEDNHLHHLSTFRKWLDELFEAVADQVAARRARGLPMSGDVVLRMEFILTEPPESAALQKWVERRTANHETPSHARGQRTGISLVAAAVEATLDFAIGGWLFGDE